GADKPGVSVFWETTPAFPSARRAEARLAASLLASTALPRWVAAHALIRAGPPYPSGSLAKGAQRPSNRLPLQLPPAGGRAISPAIAGVSALIEVIDDHLLAQNLGEPPADDASEHVGAAAGRERDHHGQRAGRPALRGGRAGALVAKPADDQR